MANLFTDFYRKTVAFLYGLLIVSIILILLPILLILLPILLLFFPRIKSMTKFFSWGKTQKKQEDDDVVDVEVTVVEDDPDIVDVEALPPPPDEP